jgi:hypothetical protein
VASSPVLASLLKTCGRCDRAMTYEVLTIAQIVTAKAMAKFHRHLMQGRLRGSRPKLDLVTVTVAAMAKVAIDRHVHRQ